jgi:hypothetical protein
MFTLFVEQMMKQLMLISALALGFNSFSQQNQSNTHQPHQSSSLYQQYDSIYYWSWDTISADWKLSHKVIDIEYDSNNNLTNYTRQNWLNNN